MMRDNQKIHWSKSLAFTLFIWFLAISIIPLLVFEYFNYQNRVKSLENKYEVALHSSASSYQVFIQNWFEDRENDISLWSQSQNSIDLFSSLETTHKQFIDINQFFESYEYALIVDKHEGDLIKISNQYDYIYDFLLIDLNGNILFSVKRNEDLGKNLRNGPLSSTKLSSSFLKTIKTGKMQFSDLEHYPPSSNLTSGFLTTPVIDNDGNLIGVMAVQILPKYIQKALDTHVEGNYHYLVGKDGISRSDFSSDKKALTIQVNNQQVQDWREKHIVNHETFVTYTNPANKTVMGIHKDIEILGIKWILISEVSHESLFADKDELLQNLVEFLFFTSLMITLLSIYLSRAITKPISDLNEASVLFTEGNRDISIIKDGGGEVGELAKSFKRMLITLSSREDELKKFANNLEERVKKEVELNSLKDKELLEQSKQAQKKLHKSITLFGENVISSNTDLKGLITYASQALCNISGYTQEELLGQPHSKLRHPDTPSYVFAKMWETIQQGKVWDGEIKNRKKNGDYYWVRTSIMPEVDENGILIGYRSIRHEITAQKVKEEFMANMSHELRTPLNSIIGFSSILKRKIENISNKDLVQQINSSANSLLVLINDILDLAKIQDSKFSIEPFEFNAYDELIELSHTSEGLTEKNTLTFKSIINENLKNIFFGDWVRINQIILNLISNAIKFTPKEGEVNFNVDYKEGSLIIRLQDNGIGMSKKVQDKIFKPFEQADGSTTRKYGGTGLGLSITQNLVEMMDGKIELESEEGKGTTFIVTIPLKLVGKTTIKQEENSQEEDEKISLDSHVLVVEDNKTNQMLIKMLLDEFGITCDVANDGVEAVDMYDPIKHSVILMDENMPNMNGLEAMRILKDKYQDKCGAIIALTANAMDGDRERFLKLGMDGYVSKPIDEDELYSCIKKLLDKTPKPTIKEIQPYFVQVL